MFLFNFTDPDTAAGASPESAPRVLGRPHNSLASSSNQLTLVAAGPWAVDVNNESEQELGASSASSGLEDER